jgi:uncharacterized membrane protein YsdA (DUF1294 family)
MRAQGHSTPPRRREPARKPPAGRPHARRPTAAGSTFAYVLMAAWAALLLWLVGAQRLPAWVLGAALALNLLTFAIYAADKRAARAGGWRVSEKQLHLLALLGGWPGAWWAQQWLRHKSSKPSFRTVYWATALVHCAGLLATAIAPDRALLPF